MHDTDLVTLLRPLDPAPAHDDDAHRRRRDAMLDRVLAAPPAPDRTARPRRTRRFAVGVVTALVLTPALVVGGAVAMDRLHPGAGSAAASGFTAAELASWTSTPQARSSAQLSAAVKDWCTRATDGQAGSTAPAVFSDTDQRGRIASTIITRGAYRDLCIASPSSGSGTSELIDGPGSPLPAVTADEVLLQSSGSQGDPATAISSAWGQVGSDVATVVLHVDGRTVTATVGHGIWSAWWPAARVGFDAPTTATVTESDGRTSTVRIATP